MIAAPPKKKTVLSHINLHGVHGNPLSAIARSDAYGLCLQASTEIKPCMQHILKYIFPSPTNGELLAMKTRSLNSKITGSVRLA